MIKNAPVLEIEYFGYFGYDYQVYIQGEKTFGFLSRDDQDNWTFNFGDTPSEANSNDSVSYEGYTLNELKKELEFELTNFYIRFGIHDCKCEL